jgi:RNA polymerase sigma factor (sigma-70 family)
MGLQRDAEVTESGTPDDRPVESVDDLVAEYFEPIYAYLARRVGRDLADDLAAEVFVRALARRSSFDPELGTWRMWLFGIATNLVAKHRRAEVRRLTAYARAGSQASAGGQTVPADGAIDRLDAADSLRVLAEALKAMSSRQRDALYLVGVAGLSYEETASSLGIPIGTVRSRVSRARAGLRAHLERTGRL